MELFRTIQPSPLLAPYIRQYWVLETKMSEGMSQRIIPTGCISLMFYRNNNVTSNGSSIPNTYLSGQFIGYRDLRASGKVAIIAVIFRPAGAKAFFKMPMNELFGGNIDASDMGDPGLSELGKRVSDETDNDRCIGLIEGFLTQRLLNADNHNTARVSAAVKAVESSITPTVTDLSSASCLSERQLNRLFAVYTGANPKQFIRILRFQKALRSLHVKPDINFAQLSADCGFYDQPHMIREFKVFSGYTPTEYVAAYTPYSDYFG